MTIIDRAVISLLEQNELTLSHLTAIFNRTRLLRSLERLVNSGSVACRYDGSEYRYRLA